MSKHVCSALVDNAVIVSFRVPWDASVDDEVAAEIQAAGCTERARLVVVDLRLIRHLPSAVVGGLISLRSQLVLEGRRLVLIRLSSEMLQQLRDLHLDREFQIHDTLAEAFDSMEQFLSERNVP